jgi:hypothetical protein
MVHGLAGGPFYTAIIFTMPIIFIMPLYTGNPSAERAGIDG